MARRSPLAAAAAVAVLLTTACGDEASTAVFAFATPSDGDFVAGTTRFEILVAPAGSVDEVVFWVGDVEVGRAAEAPFAVELDTAVYSDGPLTVTATAARATADGGVGEPAVATVAVRADNEPPTLELLPPAAAYVEDGEQLAVQLHVADGNGVTKLGVHAVGAGTDVARTVYEPGELVTIEVPLAELVTAPVEAWGEIRIVASAVDGFGRQTTVDAPFALGTRRRWAANVAGLVFRPPLIADDGSIWVGATKVSPDEGRVVRLDAATGGELCATPLGLESLYSAAQAGELIVFGTSRAVRAFRRDDCGLAWTFGDPVGAPRSYWGTPAFDAAAGRVYAADADGVVYAIDAATGAGAVFVDTAEEIQSSPIVGVGGEVFVATVAGNLYGFDGTGAPLAWSPYTAAGSFFGDPVLATRLFIGSMDTFLYALDPATGALAPGFGVAPDGFAIRSTPAVAPDGTALIATIGGSLHAIAPDGGLAWQYDVGPISRGGASVAATATGWRVYIGSTNGDVFAVDHGGTLAWRAATGAQIQTYGAVDATTYYTPSDDFRVYAFEIGPPSGPN